MEIKYKVTCNVCQGDGSLICGYRGTYEVVDKVEERELDGVIQEVGEDLVR